MYSQEFVDRIAAVLQKRLLGSFEIGLVENDLPGSIKFLVISDEFETVSRGARIQFIADTVKEAFGLPLQFRPTGRALTRSEFDAESDDPKVGHGHVVAPSDGTVARS